MNAHYQAAFLDDVSLISFKEDNLVSKFLFKNDNTLASKNVLVRDFGCER